MLAFLWNALLYWTIPVCLQCHTDACVHVWRSSADLVGFPKFLNQTVVSHQLHDLHSEKVNTSTTLKDKRSDLERNKPYSLKVDYIFQTPLSHLFFGAKPKLYLLHSSITACRCRQWTIGINRYSNFCDKFFSPNIRTSFTHTSIYQTEPHIIWNTHFRQIYLSNFLYSWGYVFVHKLWLCNAIK